LLRARELTRLKNQIREAEADAAAAAEAAAKRLAAADHEPARPRAEAVQRNLQAELEEFEHDAEMAELSSAKSRASGHSQTVKPSTAMPSTMGSMAADNINRLQRSLQSPTPHGEQMVANQTVDAFMSSSSPEALESLLDELFNTSCEGPKVFESNPRVLKIRPAKDPRGLKATNSYRSLLSRSVTDQVLRTTPHPSLCYCLALPTLAAGRWHTKSREGPAVKHKVLHASRECSSKMSPIFMVM
jgi:hypothetical protein